MAFKTVATFRRGGVAVAASMDPEALKAQVAAALAGGPVPMPSSWVGFDPGAAGPFYRPGLICVTCGQVLRSEGDSDFHFKSNLKVKKGVVISKHDTTWLPAVQEA